MRTVKTIPYRPCPPTPFDLEPDLFSLPPPITTRQMERRLELIERYRAVRQWHEERPFMVPFFKAQNTD